MTRDLEPGFSDEMALLFDYLRGRTAKEIANDETMQLANQRYEALIGKFVDKQDQKPVLCLLLGALLMRYFDGGSLDLVEIENWLTKALRK